MLSSRKIVQLLQDLSDEKESFTSSSEESENEFSDRGDGMINSESDVSGSKTEKVPGYMMR